MIERAAVIFQLPKVSPCRCANTDSNDDLAVFEFQAYAAVIVNANATALLRRSVEIGNVSYDPLGAGQVR